MGKKFLGMHVHFVPSVCSSSVFGSHGITVQEKAGSQKGSGASRLGLRYLSENISVIRNFGKLKTWPSVFRDVIPPTSHIQAWPLRHMLVKVRSGLEWDTHHGSEFR